MSISGIPPTSPQTVTFPAPARRLRSRVPPQRSTSLQRSRTMWRSTAPPPRVAALRPHPRPRLPRPRVPRMATRGARTPHSCRSMATRVARTPPDGGTWDTGRHAQGASAHAAKVMRRLVQVGIGHSVPLHATSRASSVVVVGFLEGPPQTDFLCEAWILRQEQSAHYWHMLAFPIKAPSPTPRWPAGRCRPRCRRPCAARLPLPVPVPAPRRSAAGAVAGMPPSHFGYCRL
jgi:hypothetical protein